MLGRVLEIYDEYRYLSLNRGFIEVHDRDKLLGSVPLDDIGVLLLSAQSVTISKHILNALSEQGSITILCGKNYLPQSMVLPVANHYHFTKVLKSQINASVPFKKNIWKQIVVQKIKNQALVLELCNKTADSLYLKKLAFAVKSGDIENKEGIAAKLYWKSLFGAEFVRDRTEEGINSLLNYGYAILRAAMARAVCACGLLPALGVHHKNNLNQFCLVDDFFEIYRPLVDYTVYKLVQKEETQLIPDVKQQLISTLWIKVSTSCGFSPVFQSMQYMANSYVKALDSGVPNLEIPLWVVTEDENFDIE